MHRFSHKKFPISLPCLGQMSLTEEHFFAFLGLPGITEVLRSFHMKSLLLKEATSSALHNNHTNPMQFLCLTTSFSASYLHNSAPSHSTKCTTPRSAQSSVAMVLFQEPQRQRITRDLQKYKGTKTFLLMMEMKIPCICT